MGKDGVGASLARHRAQLRRSGRRMASGLRRALEWAGRRPWSAAAVLVGLGWLFPIGYGVTRFCLLAATGTLWLWGAFLLRRRKAAMAAVLGAALLAAGWLCLPGRPADPDVVRQSYIECLRRYEGTLYVWGGENRIGIDCSGLVRRALIDANVRTGLRTLNPYPVRTAFFLWWDDCSARALRDGFLGLTVPLSAAPSLNGLAHGAISPGDLAVTASGVHVLAYLGGEKWIQADPGAMRVIVVEVPGDNRWLQVPVHLVRWRQSAPGVPSRQTAERRETTSLLQTPSGMEYDESVLVCAASVAVNDPVLCRRDTDSRTPGCRPR